MDILNAKKMLRAAAIADDSLLMEGVHGIGKSQIVEQFVNDNDYHLEILFLSHQEVGDIIGIPHKVELEDGTAITTWSQPIWLQRMKAAAQQGKRCVLFLDELNRAPIDVRQSALQLVLERRIHEHELPVVNGERSLIVSAINPADEYQVDELDAALLDRFLKITVTPDLKAWLQHAKETNVPRVIIDFLIENPKFLHFTPNESSTDNGVGTSPRSWSKFAKYIENAEAIRGSDDHDLIIQQCAFGKLGNAVGTKFYAFYRNYEDIIKMEDVVELVNEEMKVTKDPEVIGAKVSKLIGHTEAVQKTDMLDQLKAEYIDKECDDITPFHATLYAVEIEIRVGYIKSFRENDTKGFLKLVEADKVLKNKKMFTDVINASKKA